MQMGIIIEKSPVLLRMYVMANHFAWHNDMILHILHPALQFLNNI